MRIKNLQSWLVPFWLLVFSLVAIVAKYRRFLLFGTMERHGTEQNSTGNGTVQTKTNGRVKGTEQDASKLQDFFVKEQ